MRALEIVLASTLLLSAGCSRKASAEKQALAPYAQATLTPSVGLGELRLGQTTLGWAVENLGPGTASTLIGDDAAIELTYLGGEFSALFIVTGKCQQDTEAPRRRLELRADVTEFLERHPSCRELPLSSLAVSTRGKDAEDAFFQGSTDRGVKLGAAVTQTGLHGAPLRAAGQLVAGDSDDQTARVDYPGIYFYHPPAGPTAREVASGRALSKERLEELKAAKADLRVRRMAIFVPRGD